MKGAAMAKEKRRDTKLSKWLKEILGKNAPIEFQIEDDLLSGHPGRTNAEVIADAVIAEARKGKQWAIEVVYDRTEGKPVQAIKQDDGDRTFEERITDVTVKHLNDIAAHRSAPAAKPPVGADSPPPDDAGTAEPAAVAGERPARPARDFLDLPQNGVGDS
jgi:hypothetical protein